VDRQQELEALDTPRISVGNQNTENIDQGVVYSVLQSELILELHARVVGLRSELVVM
jgi:hypothetical protein